MTRAGGWLDSGDLAFRAGRRALHRRARSKDLIIKAGRNLVPQEIEEVVATVRGHPPRLRGRLRRRRTRRSARRAWWWWRRRAADAAGGATRLSRAGDRAGGRRHRRPARRGRAGPPGRGAQDVERQDPRARPRASSTCSGALGRVRAHAAWARASGPVDADGARAERVRACRRRARALYGATWRAWWRVARRRALAARDGAARPPGAGPRRAPGARASCDAGAARASRVDGLERLPSGRRVRASRPTTRRTWTCRR